MAVLTSTHNLCFGGKLRKIGIPLHNPDFPYTSGVYGAPGINIARTYFPDDSQLYFRFFFLSRIAFTVSLRAFETTIMQFNLICLFLLFYGQVNDKIHMSRTVLTRETR